MRKKQIILSLAILPMLSITSAAQDFVDLTSSQMRIDTLLPKVSHLIALPKSYQDSTYSVRLQYPEYTPLTRKQRRKYSRLTGNKLAPSAPVLQLSTYRERTNATLGIEFTPIVTHNNRLCYLSSFRPVLVSTAKPQPTANDTLSAPIQSVSASRNGIIQPVKATAMTSADTYAANSVLRQGRWAKIRVSETGIHKLTSDVIRQAGFSDISKVKIYGYGGALVPEKLTQDYLREHDDLKEIATCTIDNIKYFYAQGPVSWASATATKRTRNNYSDYGYYFITESSDTPLSCSEEQLLQQVSNSADAHHFLYEKDQYAWAEMGRNLFDGTAITPGNSMTVNVVIPAGNTSAGIQVAVSGKKDGKNNAAYRITCGKNTIDGIMSFGEYFAANIATRTFTVNDLDAYPKDESGATLYPVTVEATNATTTLRIDYVSAFYATPATPNTLASGSYPTAQYYCNITNQNLHADSPVDLIIIIPTSQKLREQAERLAECHRTYDGMTTRIVPADELYNEFSSGTPDISAYRRYLKMFYDKATDNNELPKHVLLFGDAMWDNRMRTLSPTLYSPDNYLLCYETEDSYNSITSTAIDDFITILQDGKTVHADSNTGRDATLQFDIGVGRIPVVQSGEAKNVVDKIIQYISGATAGAWQNEIMFMGDDGDNNSHMSNINSNADDVMERSPGYIVRKVMLDAYEKQSSAAGDTYPIATETVKKQQNNGALIMNYGGHSSWTLLSHEKLLVLSDFATFKGSNLPLWFTAGCETVPFDGTVNTLGETALLNANGGAVAFIGTVRTVNETQNSMIDKAFMKHVLSYDNNGKPLAIGEALRLAKNDLVTGKAGVGTDLSVNKHHYTIIGDPAMSLALPTQTAVIDYINDIPADEQSLLKGNSTVNIRGHIATRNGEPNTSFNGTANILIRDTKQEITCRGNDTKNNTRFIYTDRPGTLYKGTCTVSNGQFTFTFKMPRDISDSDGQGLITVYALDPANRISANGECGNFSAQDWEDVSNDMIGPSIYAYLNNPSFTNGAAVGRTPFFVAEITDNDGINATGNSLGHNMELIIDGQASMTYDITDNFMFDANSYTCGQTYYVLPPLSNGSHSLSFKAWDLLGNSNSVSLAFNVVKGLQPEVTDINVAPNPVKDSATFYVTHDMQGSAANIFIDIIDPSGRIVEILQWEDVFSETNRTTTYRWTPSGISRGLYMYRVRVSCDGSDFVSQTKKLIIAQ